MDFFIKVYSPSASAAIQFQVGFVTLRLDKHWLTSSTISNLKPYESLPTNSHVAYIREINRLRRFKREDVGKGGLKDCPATASSRFCPASGPPSARLFPTSGYKTPGFDGRAGTLLPAVGTP